MTAEAYGGAMFRTLAIAVLAAVFVSTFAAGAQAQIGSGVPNANTRSASPPVASVVAPGFSCRMQIAHFTGRAAVHPAELLAEIQA